MKNENVNEDIFWFNGKTKCTGKHRNGMKDGKWIYYYSDGSHSFTKWFVEDEEVWESEYKEWLIECNLNMITGKK